MPRIVPPLTREQIAEAAGLRAQGWSQDRIAARLDVPINLIRRAFPGSLPRTGTTGNHSAGARSGVVTRAARRLLDA